MRSTMCWAQRAHHLLFLLLGFGERSSPAECEAGPHQAALRRSEAGPHRAAFRRRRSALLLEVLVAMAIAAVGLIALFEGPVLLIRHQNHLLHRLHAQRSVEILLIEMQASLLQHGGAAAQRWAEPVQVLVRNPMGEPQPLRVQAHFKKLPVPIEAQGERWRIDAAYELRPHRKDSIRTSIYLKGP